ncbi:unnamed protein product, partial [Mesorhabditis belari]|uniref:F-box domain-containing protein n=1 Tax=Mesorhabditis belari TaxID=2138241 RepID=A0AAF3F3B6_9BILA
MEFSNLPHDILLEVFKMCPQSDRVKGRRLSKRLNQVLTSRGAPKLVADVFKVSAVEIEDRCVPIGRLNFHKSSKTRRIVSISLKRHQRNERVFEATPTTSNASKMPKIPEIVQQQLEQVKIGSALSFDGAAVHCNTQLLHSLLNNDLRSVSSLSFTMCHIEWTDAEFSQLVAHTSPVDLVFDFCHFHADFLTDKVFTQMPRLQSLSVQARSWARFPALTDETLQGWATNCPKSIRLSNQVISGFTLEGIRQFVQNAPESNFELDLGLIVDTAAESLGKILMIPKFSVTISDEYLSRRVVLTKMANGSSLPNFVHNFSSGFQDRQKFAQKISFSVYTPQISSAQ